MAKGDHIYVNCGVYDHHGIDCGNGTVIHYEGKYRGGRITGGIIKRAPKMTFALSKTIHVRAYSEKSDSPNVIVLADRKTIYLPNFLEKSDSPDAVVLRAESRLGEEGYNLIFNNCEHFSNWCKTGQYESKQIEKVQFASGIILGGIGLGVAGITGAGIGLGLVLGAYRTLKYQHEGNREINGIQNLLKRKIKEILS